MTTSHAKTPLTSVSETIAINSLVDYHSRTFSLGFACMYILKYGVITWKYKYGGTRLLACLDEALVSTPRTSERKEGKWDCICICSVTCLILLPVFFFLSVLPVCSWQHMYIFLTDANYTIEHAIVPSLANRNLVV